MHESETITARAFERAAFEPANQEARGIGMAVPRPPRFLDIGQAIAVLRRGGAVTRRGWDGPNQRLHLSGGEAVPRPALLNSDMTLPFVYIVTVHGDKVPWLASQTDILATDWVEVALTVDDRR